MRTRIRRGLGSRQLPCRCLAGIYETYADEIIMIVDVPAQECSEPAHRRGEILPVPRGAHALDDRDPG